MVSRWAESSIVRPSLALPANPTLALEKPSADCSASYVATAYVRLTALVVVLVLKATGTEPPGRLARVALLPPAFGVPV